MDPSLHRSPVSIVDVLRVTAAAADRRGGRGVVEGRLITGDSGSSEASEAADCEAGEGAPTDGDAVEPEGDTDGDADDEADGGAPDGCDVAVGDTATSESLRGPPAPATTSRGTAASARAAPPDASARRRRRTRAAASTASAPPGRTGKSVTGGSQQATEDRAGLRQLALDGPDRAAGGSRDVGDREVGVVVQQQDVAQLGR